MADFARSTHPGVQAQLDRLSKLSPAGDRLGLERMTVVLDRLGRPQDALPPVFHVAGQTARDRPSLSSASRSKPAAIRSTHSPARTSFASTSGSGSPGA
jgi:hypothetical protein